MIGLQRASGSTGIRKSFDFRYHKSSLLLFLDVSSHSKVGFDLFNDSVPQQRARKDLDPFTTL